MALLTVYTMGDIPIFTSVLNGVAMIFKSSMFDPGQGASIFVLGFMLTVLLLIIPATWGGKLNPMPLIFLIFLLYAGTYPKEPLQVEDIYTGTATIVADIPLIISLPASVTASVSKKITDVVETAFQTTNGSYLAMGAEGFVNPLKLMLSLRDPNQTMRAFPYLSQSITEYIKYCAPTDATFSTKALSSAPDMVGYLAGLQVSGVMTYWDVANPMGFGTSCVDGKARLKADTTAAKMTADAENLLKTTTGGDYSQNATGLGASMAGLTQSYNSVTSGILGNMQTGQQFMVNAVAMVPTKQGIDCINQPTGPNMSECMGNVIQREALEKQNMDAAAQAGIFTKTMIPAMNILLLLFYAFAPVIIAYAFLAGPHALKMLAGYLLFGVWTQSWMPIAAIMNYIIQMQTQYAFSAFPKTGFTMENYMQFYSILTMKLGIASTLMASIPMITFGLLSGSAMAMTNVAGSMSAKDYTDENKVAPSVGSNDAVTKNGSQYVQNGGGMVNISRGQNGLQIVNGGGALAEGDHKNISLGAGADATIGEQKVLQSQANKTAGKEIAHGITKTRQESDQVALNHKIGTAIKRDETAGSKKLTELTEGMQHKYGWSDAKREAIQAKMYAKTQAGVSWAGNEAVIGAELGDVNEMSKAEQQELAASMAKTDTNGKSVGDAIGQSFSMDGNKALSKTIGQTLGLTDSATYKQAVAQSDSASAAIQQAESYKATFGATTQAKTNSIASGIVANSQTAGEAEIRDLRARAIKSGISGETFDQKVKERMANIVNKYGQVANTSTEKMAVGMDVLSEQGRQGMAELQQFHAQFSTANTGPKREEMSKTDADRYEALTGDGNNTAGIAHQKTKNSESNAAPAEYIKAPEKLNSAYIRGLAAVAQSNVSDAMQNGTSVADQDPEPLTEGEVDAAYQQFLKNQKIQDSEAAKKAFYTEALKEVVAPALIGAAMGPVLAKAAKTGTKFYKAAKVAKAAKGAKPNGYAIYGAKPIPPTAAEEKIAAQASNQKMKKEAVAYAATGNVGSATVIKSTKDK